MGQKDEPGVCDDGALDRIAVYRVALELSDLACDDALRMRQEPLLVANAAQLIRAVGSIAANVAEGYARSSSKERIRFYGYALGSAEEARTWYRVSRPLLRGSDIDDRVHLLVRIRQLLLTMIRNERLSVARK